MIKNPRTRRALSLTLIIGGGVLLFLAPEDVWVGGMLLGLGVVLELVGTFMKQPPEA